jgi:type IV pilus assembly protein PilV
MNSQPDIARHQSGVILLEALLAILIFSLGILALVGLQAAAVKQSADAKYRTEAALLTNEIIGQMWVSDRTTAVLQANFNTGGTAYNNWFARVSGILPGVAANPPTVAIDGQGIATVTVSWAAPNEPAGTQPHQYVAIAQIR